MITIHSSVSFLSNALSLRTGAQGSPQSARSSDEARALANPQGRALTVLAREVPGAGASDPSALDPNDFTPEKVAERITQFVAAGLDKARAAGKSEEEVQQLYDDAMQGIEKGFREAKETLSEMRLLKGDIAAQLEETERMTFESLADLSPVKPQQGVTEAGTVGFAVAERYQRADDFELTLKTREGDRVKISFSRDLDAQATLAGAADGQGNQVTSLDVSRSESTGYRFQVKGDLNAEEIDAIQNLVRDVGEVANEFFNGDVQKAFEQVSNISFDDSQLASMKLHMSRVDQHSAAQRYQQTQQLENPEQARSNLRLGHLARSLSESAQDPMLEFLDQARAAVSQIMQGLVEQDGRFKDANAEQQSLYQGNLGRLLGALDESL